VAKLDCIACLSGFELRTRKAGARDKLRTLGVPARVPGQIISKRNTPLKLKASDHAESGHWRGFLTDRELLHRE
jgi:hypothetical protein